MEIAFGDLLASPLRNGVSYPSRTRGSGVPMVNMREIFAYDRIGDIECELVPLSDKEREVALLEPGDILFARQSLTYDGAGKVSLVFDGPHRTWDSHLIRARLDRRIADPGYYYYFFRSAEGRRRVETIIQQVAAAGIRGSELAKLKVPFPPRPEQQAIAEVLGALDDKIAANTKLAATADELVRAEYASLDPSNRVRISDVAVSPRDLVDPGSIDSDTVYVGLEHIPRGLMWLSESGAAVDVTSTKSRFKAGDVLFGKLRPYFHKVVSAPSLGICSTDVLVIRARDTEPESTLLAALSSDEVVSAVTAASEGTRMPRTSWRDLAALEVPWPTHSERDALERRLAAIRKATVAVLAENRTLAATRDALLPQLMSGKLRVRDAEAAASEVGV